MASTTFAVLNDVHHWLDELFLQHQDAVLAHDVPEAQRRLAAYKTALISHIDDEDHRLVPVYDARTANIQGGGTQFFFGEHVKLQEILAHCEQLLDGLDGLDGDAWSRQAIALLDREAFYKSLVEHHHAREQNILFPWLDKVTSDGERADLLAHCHSLAAYQASRA